MQRMWHTAVHSWTRKAVGRTKTFGKLQQGQQNNITQQPTTPQQYTLHDIACG